MIQWSETRDWEIRKLGPGSTDMEIRVPGWGHFVGYQWSNRRQAGSSFTLCVLLARYILGDDIPMAEFLPAFYLSISYKARLSEVHKPLRNTRFQRISQRPLGLSCKREKAGDISDDSWHACTSRLTRDMYGDVGVDEQFQGACRKAGTVAERFRATRNALEHSVAQE